MRTSKLFEFPSELICGRKGISQEMDEPKLFQRKEYPEETSSPQEKPLRSERKENPNLESGDPLRRLKKALEEDSLIWRKESQRIRSLKPYSCPLSQRAPLRESDP